MDKWWSKTSSIGCRIRESVTNAAVSLLVWAKKLSGGAL